MRIKVYMGCAVDGHNGVYTPMIFAERAQYNNPMPFTTEQRDILLAGPEHEEYIGVASDLFPIETVNIVYEYSESGDILTYELIDSNKITVGELNKYVNNENFGKYPVYECNYGHADIAQIGENCLCRVNISNAGIIGADCFFEMDDYFSFDENLQQFIEQEIEPILHAEFAEDYEIYTLPAYWASYLINGDCSGMDDAEITEVDEFCRDKGCCVGCSDEEEFRWRNDANKLGGSTLEFYFEVKKA